MSLGSDLILFINDLDELTKSRDYSKNKIWAQQLKEILGQYDLSPTDLSQLDEIISSITMSATLDMSYEKASLYLRILIRKNLQKKQKQVTRAPNTPLPPIRTTTVDVVSRMLKAREPIQTEVVPVKPEVAPIQAKVAPIVKTPPTKLISKTEIPQITKSDKIFIVHGHDDTSKLELARMIEKMGLEAIILHEKPNEGKTIIEKFETHSKDVDFAFVLLTPDDLGGKDKDRLNKRARQNVILELGFFMGKLGRSRVCCIHKSEVEVPTDYSGVTFLPFKESVKECHEGIIRELKSAGYSLKI